MPSAKGLRFVAFACALLLSVGAHYGRELLGPLKSQLMARFGGSHLQFSLLFSAYTLSSTVTPLLTPLLASKIGMAWTSVLATATILLGQTIVSVSSIFNVQLGLLVGMLTFGLAVSPVALCSEYIIIRFFKKHSLGVSMAFGLLGGKGASFLSSVTAYPLSTIWIHLPFVIAAVFALLSFLANLVYLRAEAGLVKKLRIRDKLEAEVLVDGEGESKDVDVRRHLEGRKVKLGDIAVLGDAFWAYILFSGLCGALWNPLTHNLPYILQIRYDWSESAGAFAGSTVLFGALVMYPLAGLLIDQKKSAATAVWLLFFTSACTLCGFAWFALPPSLTRTPAPGVFFHAVGTGCGTLALVLAVPFIVQDPWVATALGAHKSAESALSALAQSGLGLWLDRKLKHSQNITSILVAFLLVNCLQMACALYLRHKLQAPQELPSVHIARDSARDEGDTTDDSSISEEAPLVSPQQSAVAHPLELHCTRAQRIRGRAFAGTFFGLIVATWLVFFTIAARKRA